MTFGVAAAVLLAVIPRSSLPTAAVVMTGEPGLALLSQCSRPVPAKAQATFAPKPSEIRRLEAVLATAVGKRADLPRGVASLDFAKAPNGWARQYVGLIRHGHRFVYGNFFPRADLIDMRKRGSDPSTTPFVVCDGGPAFFGVEFDLTSGRVTHVAFNGPG